MVRSGQWRGATMRPSPARASLSKIPKAACSAARSAGVIKESTLLYVPSHTTPHTNLHINKSTEA
jgi:hypothetical protein